MNTISNNPAVQNAQTVRPLTEVAERECVARLASEVPEHGTIVEIGCLYGGTTGVLALANPKARVIAIDNFSWHPEGDVPTSAELVRQNMQSIGANNVTVIEGDSLRVGWNWAEPIHFLWVDGGHTYEMAYADLCNFGPHAKAIAVHDYHNNYWAGVKKAVTQFLEEHPEFEIAEVVHWVAVLRRK
jgi:predicted O-methyltransferase YrrM